MKGLRLWFSVILIHLGGCQFLPAATASPSTTRSEPIIPGKADTNYVRRLLNRGKQLLYKSDRDEHDLANALNIFNNALDLSSSLASETLILESKRGKGEVLIKSAKYEEGRSLFNSLIKEWRKKGNERGEAYAWYQFALSFMEESPHFVGRTVDDRLIDEMLGYLEHAYRLAQWSGDRKLMCEVMVYQADFLRKQGKLDLAEKIYKNVIHFQQTFHLPNNGNAYVGLLNNNYFRGDYRQALFYGLKAIRNAEKSGQWNDLAHLYYHVGNIYRDLGERPNAREMYQKGVSIMEIHHQTGAVYLSLIKNWVKELIYSRRPKDALVFVRSKQRLVRSQSPWMKMMFAEAAALCFQAMGDVNKTEAYFESMLYWGSKMNDSIRRLPGYEALARFNFSKGNFKRADRYLQLLLNAPKGTIPVSYISEVHYMKYKVDSLQGNYVDALRHLAIHKALNDDIFALNKRRSITDLQLRYESEKKEQNIRLLQNQSRLRQNELNRARFAQKITIVGAAILALVVVLLYKSYHLKKRSNHSLLLKQQAIHQQNMLLTKLNTDKEWLLREIHHRVKNNLQIVMSLLNSQTYYIKDSAAMSAIKDSRRRVNAIALIHKKLYQGEDLAGIPMDQYVSELITYFKHNLSNGRKVPQFNVNIPALLLDVSGAVPVGLIINEALTNCLKYAFDDITDARISIQLQKNNGYIELAVFDNGIGLPPDFDVEAGQSFGIHLMKGLSEQLKGQLTITGEHGVKVSLKFPDSYLVNE